MQAMEQSTHLAERGVIAQLARDASIELNVQDLKDLEASRSLLSVGKRMYISHLPKQQWKDSLSACEKVSSAGFDPIPHIPVRLVESEPALDRLLDGALKAGAKEILLISGDYARAVGPYSQVSDVLRANKLKQHGFSRVSFAGHPEGHPTIGPEEIRRAQLEKAALAAPFDTTFVTQFFFEAAPFLRWASDLRSQGVKEARLIAGLAGPASITSLLKYAKRCGVGPSARALVGRPGAFGKLLGDHGPETLIHDLAVALEQNAAIFNGLHFFCFGGYLRTCEWLKRMSATR
jgi:methylenetetrahydrofolate reductase (NADPH)